MQAARIISYIFHPVLSPALTLIIILNLDFYTALYLAFSTKLYLSILILITTFVLPSIAMILMKRTGFISSLRLNERKERTLPYLFTAIFYYISFHSVNGLVLPSLIALMLLGATVAVFMTMLINFVWKISAHMVGIGGITGLFTGLSVIYQIDLLLLIVVLIALSGIIAWARLRLSTHSSGQIYTGYLLGVSVMIGILLLVR